MSGNCWKGFVKFRVGHLCSEEEASLAFVEEEIYSGDGVEPTRKFFAYTVAHRDKSRE
jgi:hypothetical protein